MTELLCNDLTSIPVRASGAWAANAVKGASALPPEASRGRGAGPDHLKLCLHIRMFKVVYMYDIRFIFQNVA